MSAPSDGARADARKRLAAEVVGMDALRASLSWHFRCHAEEPERSYASLGIANAETIVARLIADAKAEAWDEGYRSGIADEATSQEWTNGQVPPARRNPYCANSGAA